MQRSILLEMIPIKLNYHKFKDSEIIEREEDGNIIVQGAHMIFVFKENEALIWNFIDGKNTVGNIVNLIINDIKEKDYDVSDYKHIEKVIMDFIETLKDYELIKYE